MKRTWIIIFVISLLAQMGRAQVVLPSSSEYDDPYTYYRDCVDQNGEGNGQICEQQTGAFFPSEEQENEALSLQQNDERTQMDEIAPIEAE